jgi:dolichol-phosphate mannosyltransferase
MGEAKHLIIIPTYNEAENVPGIISGLSDLRKSLPPESQFNLLIVDDNSPDGTANLIDELGEDWIRVLLREGKQGLGSAYKVGFHYAIQNEFEFTYEMDADGSHRVQDLPKLICAPESWDLVLGSRWIKGGSIENWPVYRKYISKFGNLYSRTLLRLEIHDLTSGYRRLRVDTLKQLPFNEISSKGYSFQIEMAALFAYSGNEILEVPIKFIERTKGESKMNSKIALEALMAVSKMAIKRKKWILKA